MANLLNLNVDTLFEQHSVSEIDVVHKKIQTVVENKREELRTHVGERYRDLLKAADTIAAMQTSAGTLIEQVHCIQANCRSLNEQQLLGFKTTAAPATEAALQQRNANKKLQSYYGTMVQIKLLTSLPELIWTHIDNEEFFAATELFIFSRHISTGLQLDGKSALMQKLPVARKQWEILRPFHLTIKQAVLAVLEREELSPEITVDCMQSLLLLDKCDLSTVLQTFLNLRASAFLNCLQSRLTEPRRVKERILASLGILNSTIELLEKCLLENGLLFTRLAECSASTCPPSISRMESSERQLAHLLPEIIAGFKPQFDVPKLSSEQLGKSLQQWLDKMNALAAAQLQQIFALVSNMQTIQDIKSSARSTGRPTFVYLEQQLKLEHSQLDFYATKYVPLINARVREIIRSSWAEAMRLTYEKVLSMIEAGVSTPPLQIWKEQNDDLPLSLAAALSDQPKRLANRTKGYGAPTIDLCKQFDSQLADIVQELNVLLQEQTTRTEDKMSLIKFLRETAQEQVTEYLSKLKSLKLRERPALLQALRNSLALVELCPNLKLCFCQPPSWRQWSGSQSGVGIEHWQRICGLIEEEMMSLWLLIVEDVLTAHSCQEKLTKIISHEAVLRDFALWQTITLEQRDEEQEQSVQSTIRIPSQPRLSLQTYLHQLIHALNLAVPQTLPSKVLHAFNQKLLGQLLGHYEGLASAECTKTSQNIALQLYFDLKFLERVFAVSREERTLYDRIHSQQNALRDCIDPFDFELFAEHISTQVGRSTARLQGELGVLTPCAPATAQNTTVLAHESDPNVLCLSSSGSTSLWFPLLPIVMPHAAGGFAGTERKPKPIETDDKTATATTTTTGTTTTTPTKKSSGSGTRKGDNSKSKSGAASFFGMSQEWFR
ncbi:conserved oligomeric Golgi complex subunit 1 [Drosophila guanche]|uniref:Conserved oligomeric Golgi complex subunit 1 n=1 Tax=Drosophila guanche TaxID=7266 RepID=A0A3B0JQK2_DROGU|nr:conserved oligomeric Golgi complex subunit 1 [Drosophila guanche]SPP84454.1 blast:Conserved oligomeric Golgi complex subunit 1 [Drosophila guanche]